MAISHKKVCDNGSAACLLKLAPRVKRTVIDCHKLLTELCIAEKNPKERSDA